MVEAAGKLPCQAALIDGEVIVQDEKGLSDFDALRSAIHKAPHRIVFRLQSLRLVAGKAAHASAKGSNHGGSAEINTRTLR